MKRLAMIFVLCLPAGLTHGTFELEDPAARIFEELAAMREREAKQQLETNTVCEVDSETGDCSCIHEETGQKISVTREECEVRALKLSDIQER